MTLNKEIYVFGHQNPDTDSICSSIAYTKFKKLKGYSNINVYRLGNLNKETKFILDFFKMEIPDYLESVKPKLADVNLYEPINLTKDDSIKKAWLLLKNSSNSKIITIINENEKIEGIISLSDITNFFMSNENNNFSDIYNKKVKYIMNKDNIEIYNENDYIEEIYPLIKSSTHKNFPVIGNNGTLKGILSLNNILKYNKKNVILVDHNESIQSANGIEKTNILEVIDHHRVANIHTEAPLFMRVEPVGCTSTIVYKIYKESNIDIPKNIAGIMLSAILSDTLKFTSPTCTKDDIEAVKDLSKIAEIDIDIYSKEMFKAGTSLSGYTPNEILNIDIKRFTFGNTSAYVSQVNTMDQESINKIRDSLLESMEILAKDKKCDVVVLMITDILKSSSELLIVGNLKDIVKKAFGINKEEKSIFLEGVVSRKKQVIPIIASTLE